MKPPSPIASISFVSNKLRPHGPPFLAAKKWGKEPRGALPLRTPRFVFYVSLPPPFPRHGRPNLRWRARLAGWWGNLPKLAWEIILGDSVGWGTALHRLADSTQLLKLTAKPKRVNASIRTQLKITANPPFFSVRTTRAAKQDPLATSDRKGVDVFYRGSPRDAACAICVKAQPCAACAICVQTQSALRRRKRDLRSSTLVSFGLPGRQASA